MIESGLRRARVVPVIGVLVALALVAAGVTWLVPPASPPVGQLAGDAPALENDELVLADLEPNGLPIQAQLVSTIVARGGEERVVQDPASTVNVAYVNRRGAPQTGDGVVLVEIGGDGTTRAVTEATFDRPLPVALHAEYTLNGEVVAPEAVRGAEGRLGIRYTVTNTTAEQQTLSYQDATGTEVRRQAPVFVPFAGTLEVRLPGGLDVVRAPGAVRTTDAQGLAVLGYTLLLAPPLGSFQTDLAVELQAIEGATPHVTLAVEPATSATDSAMGFGYDALSGAADGNSELAQGLGELGEQTGRLAGGAEALADGASAVAAGAGSLADGIGGPLLRGGRQLEGGAAELAAGAAALEAGVGQAGGSAAQLAGGLAALSDGLGELSAGLVLLASPQGLGQAQAAAGALGDAARQIADSVGSAGDGPWPDLPQPPVLPDDVSADELAVLVEQYLADLAERAESVPEPTLVQSLRVLEQASLLLVKVAAVLVGEVEEQKAALDEAAASAASADDGAQGLIGEVCGASPTLSADQCVRLGEVQAQASAASQAAASAQVSAVGQAVLAGALGLGAGGVAQALGLLESAVTDLSTALRSGDPAEPGLVEGLDLLRSGLDESVEAVDVLASVATAAMTGSGELTAGTEALVDGVTQAASGVATLSDGADALADGASANLAGVAELAEGADELAVGARQAAQGSDGVAAGVRALQSEGIDPVADAVAQSVDDPAFAAAWVAANDVRAGEALPYGPPEGAVGHVAYRLTMAATAHATVPPWQLWLVGGVGVGLLAMLAARRLRYPDDNLVRAGRPAPDANAET